jgi:hypothetical protein
MTYEEEMNLQSYLIWEQEGCPIGDDLKHWRRAKTELEAKRDADHQQANFFR